MVPITITRHKKTKLDGSAKLLLYGYGSYGSSMSPGFSSTRISLIERDIIWVTSHIRGGMEKGCLLYTSPSPRDRYGSRMPSSA